MFISLLDGFDEVDDLIHYLRIENPTWLPEEKEEVFAKPDISWKFQLC